MVSYDKASTSAEPGKSHDTGRYPMSTANCRDSWSSELQKTYRWKGNGMPRTPSVGYSPPPPCPLTKTTVVAWSTKKSRRQAAREGASGAGRRRRSRRQRPRRCNIIYRVDRCLFRPRMTGMAATCGLAGRRAIVGGDDDCQANNGNLVCMAVNTCGRQASNNSHLAPSSVVVVDESESQSKLAAVI